MTPDDPNPRPEERPQGASRRAAKTQNAEPRFETPPPAASQHEGSRRVIGAPRHEGPGLEVAAIVLAAGRSARFSGGAEGRTKLTEDVEGKPLVRHVAEAALASGAATVTVVTGHAREAVMGALAGLALREAPNARYAEGIASSVIAGVAALPASSAGALVLLGDMPRVDAALCRRLIAEFSAHPDADAVAPVVEGRRGNPVLLARSLFADVARLAGDEGARKLLMRPGLKVREIAADDESAALDIDTPEALAALRAGRAP